MLKVMVVLVTKGPPRELGPRSAPLLPRVGDCFTMTADGASHEYRVEVVDTTARPVNVFVAPV
jgi:hypothetical protein